MTGKTDTETLLWGGSWLPPAIFALAAVALWATGTNEAAFRWMNGWSATTGDAPWAGLTILGDALVLPAIMLPLVWLRPRLVWGLLVAALLTTAITHGLKAGLPAARPAAVLGVDGMIIIGPTLMAHAMPSGHASAAMTAAGALVRGLRHPGLRVALFVTFFLAALSRVVVGAHWPIDVMVGAAIGWTSGLAGVWTARGWAWAERLPAVSGLAIVLAACAIALFFYETGYAEARGFQYALAVASLALSIPAARYYLASRLPAR